MNTNWTETGKSSRIWARTTPLLKDIRGYFSPIHQTNDEIADFQVKQQNISFSHTNVLRGLHAEVHQAQIVTVVSGTIREIVVDLRGPDLIPPRIHVVDMKSFELNQILIPENCFHGYVVTSDFAIIHYSSSTLYSPNNQRGIHWNSEELADKWGIVNPIISARDASFPSLSEYIQSSSRDT